MSFLRGTVGDLPAPLLLAAAILAGAAVRVEAKLLMSREAAFAEAFGAGARIETESHFLTPTQVTGIERSAQAKLTTPRVVAYRATRDDALLGTAYLDTHLVRTLSETVMIVVSPEGRVARVEVLAFSEPEDYLVGARWLERLAGRSLSPDLRPGGELDAVTGATLTTRAISAAVRRSLAVHAELAAAERTGP